MRGVTLQAGELSKDYGHGPVLDKLSFEVPAGETLAIIGPSGCGKSTLLRLLANLETPSGGVILHDGAPPAAAGPARRELAVILQDYGLFPWKTVEDNLTLPLRLRGASRREQRERGAAMLEELGLSGLERRYPAELSGGQRQRVAIGRALITEPAILFMDEPFSSLDALTRERLQHVVLDVWRRRRPTCVLVTHSVEEAVFLGAWVLVLGGKPARERLWLRNPCVGDAACREREEGISLIRRVRLALGGETGEEADCGRERASGPERAPARDAAWPRADVAPGSAARENA